MTKFNNLFRIGFLLFLVPVLIFVLMLIIASVSPNEKGVPPVKPNTLYDTIKIEKRVVIYDTVKVEKIIKPKVKKIVSDSILSVNDTINNLP